MIITLGTIVVVCIWGGISATDEAPIVLLPDGTKVRGETFNGVTSFKGIPFAEPPLGNLRWSPPVKWVNTDPSEVIDATSYGSPCKQTYFDGVEMGSEDCLYLNIWTSQNHSNKTSVPVAIYIHGGSYMSGAGSDIDGADFVQYWGGDVIIVSMNYRLNVFGFSGSDDLRSQDTTDSSTGNYGLQDQRMAMQWVHNNIISFGGDPHQIIIFGESAGAGSVSNHVTMTKSFPYFTAAILESGSFVQWVTQPFHIAQSAYSALASSLSCPEISPLQCLLHKSTEDIYDASRSIQSTNIAYGTPYNPTVDNVELLTHPWLAAAQGAVADVPILHGTNRDEGSMFVPLTYTATQDDLIAYWRVYYPSDRDIQTLLDFYVTGPESLTYPMVVMDGQVVSDYWWAGQRSIADGSFFCAAKYSSRQLSRQYTEGTRSSTVYLYHFDYLAAGSSVPFVQHTNEIPLVFHTKTYPRSLEDVRMADMMAGYWGAFVKEHNPNAKGPEELPMWPKYRAKEDNLLTLAGSEKVFVTTGLHDDICEFFNTRAEAAIKADFSTF